MTPNAGFFINNYEEQTSRTAVIQTTQEPKIWGIHVGEKIEQNNNVKIDKPNLENNITFMENDEKHVNKLNLSDNDVNSISTDYDVTTESTTEYESTVSCLNTQINIRYYI